MNKEWRNFFIGLGIIMLLAILFAWIFRPQPLPPDNAIQQAVTERAVAGLMKELAERRVAEQLRAAAIQRTLDNLDTMYQRLDLPAIQEQAHDRFKHTDEDSLRRYLRTAPIGLWERAVGK